jgi:hypothetical protein
VTSLRPVCDRHTNLQMIPCSLKTTTAQAHGHAYVCPVPGCGRHHDDRGYFDAVETRALLEDSAPKSRRDAARAAIMKALEERVRPSILPYKQK